MASLDVYAVVRDCKRRSPHVVVSSIRTRKLLFRQRAVIRVEGPLDAVKAFRVALQVEAANRAGAVGSSPGLM